jgi:2-keto-4-pentenoate hydratase/2-oxohepta-3-ene-1,7-dioic acid hydratase in catechol pathway
VIGTRITKRTQVTDENLAEYVAGIVITNDVSARDVQIQQNQWFKGKSFRTFCPTGPYVYLLDAEDIPRLLDMEIRLEVNGETRQKANTNQLLYRPAETLTELSGLMDLNPGDLIQTGTPGGVAISIPSARAQRIARILMDERKIFSVFMKRQLKNPNYLKDGDVLTLSMRSRDGKIDLGKSKTRVVPEK